jgi:hypothetical protein
LAVLLLIAVPASAQNPPLKGLQTYGCEVNRLEGEWRLEVWGKYEAGAEWRLQLSRDASLDKALRRCNEWFKKVEKATKPKAKH